MSLSGLFVTLYDVDTLSLYLDKGIYGFLMPPSYGNVNSRSMHYRALADYACVRDGTHVFFFLNRKIVYGGQISGSKEYGSFCLNGTDSPMGQKANANLCWDESYRPRYRSTDKPGIFYITDNNGNEKKKCQPYLIRFEDKQELKGKYIWSDQLYWKLGQFGYPLPSNSIQNMSFCTLTPGETNIAITLLKEEPAGISNFNSEENVYLVCEPVSYSPRYDISNLALTFQNNGFVNEAHLEASIIANPYLLPEEMRPNIGDTLCRQIPISPFKPYHMDRADICYYSNQNPINNGTVPNVVIELKRNRANNSSIRQVERYLDWLSLLVKSETASKLEGYLLAPSFTRNVHVDKHVDQIKLFESGNSQITQLEFG